MTGNLKPANQTDEPLMPLADLPSPGAKGFTLGEGVDSVDIFIVRSAQGEISGYRNRCPHAGTPLDWAPDQFLSIDQDFIQCATHDALFRPDDGFCVFGPCSGASLEPVRIELRNDMIVLAEAVSIKHR